MRHLISSPNPLRRAELARVIAADDARGKVRIGRQDDMTGGACHKGDQRTEVPVAGGIQVKGASIHAGDPAAVFHGDLAGPGKEEHRGNAGMRWEQAARCEVILSLDPRSPGHGCRPTGEAQESGGCTTWDVKRP